MEILKKHYIAAIIALIAGSASYFPQIIAAHNVPNFQGIYKSVNLDEQYYMARARDIIDGHSLLSNPYLYEYKNGQPMQFWLPDFLLAKPLALLRIDLHKGFFFYDFLLPFLLVLSSYGVFLKITKSVPISAIGTLFLHLGMFLSEFGRAPSPQLIFIFWLLLLLFWLKFLENPSVFNTVALGTSFGLLFHIYPYYWTFYAAAFFIFICLNLFLKKDIPLNRYFFAFAIAAVIFIPYFISLFKSMQLPYFADSVARVGMIDSRFPAGRRVVMWNLFTLLLYAFLYRKKIIDFGGKTLLFAGGCLAVIAVVNQHLITGKYLQFSNHYWQLGAFWSVFAAAYGLSLWLKRMSEKTRRIAFSAVGIIAIASVYAPLANAYDVRYSQIEIERQDYAPMLAWLNKNAESEETVYAGSELSYLIPIYTANNVFYAGMAGLHFMPNSEFQERYVLNNYWDDYNIAYVNNNHYALKGAYYRSKQWHNLTKNNYRKVLFLQPVQYKMLPAEEIGAFINFAEQIKSAGLEEQLNKYRVDYVIWDKEKNPEWKISQIKSAKPVYDSGRFAVYNLKSDYAE